MSLECEYCGTTNPEDLDHWQGTICCPDQEKCLERVMAERKRLLRIEKAAKTVSTFLFLSECPCCRDSVTERMWIEATEELESSLRKE